MLETLSLDVKEPRLTLLQDIGTQMSRYILIFCISISICSNLSANHLIGGDVTYRCVNINSDSTRAEIQLEFQIFRDGRTLDERAATFFDSMAVFGVYRNINGNWQYVTHAGPFMSSIDEMVPLNDLECLVFPPSLIMRRGLYRFNVELDIIEEDYMIAFQRCCRGQNITNLRNAQDEGSVFSIEITKEGLLSCNDGIKFRQFPPSILCSGFTFRYDHSVTDAEGDSVVYELCNPISSGSIGGPPRGINCEGCMNPHPTCNCNSVQPCPQLCGPNDFREVQFLPPFSVSEPVAGDPPITINSRTGLITGTPSLLGELVMAVCATEYDEAGNVLTRIRRDMQFVVTQCEKDIEARIASNKTLEDGTFELIVCGDSTVQFINQSRPSNAVRDFEWTFDVGNGQEANSNIENPLIQYPGFGTYDARLIINPNNFICVDTADIQVGIFPDINADYGLSFDSCIATPIDFFDRSETMGDFIETWSWDFGDGNFSNQQDPTHFYSEPGLKEVVLTVIDNNECQDTAVRSFFYSPLPENLAVLPNFFITCVPGTVTFDNISEPIDENYDVFWDFGDNSMGPEQTVLSPTHTYTEPGSYTVRLSVTSPNGCTGMQSFNDLIEILDGFETDFTFSPDNPSNQNPTVSFFGESDVPGDFFWDFGDGGVSFDINPVHTFEDTGTYNVTLIVTDATGCMDSISKPLQIATFVDLLFPNAFTPDGDDLNDNFLSKGEKSLILEFELLIFDRWGKVVFSTNDPDLGWNGKLNNNGQLLPMGVYTYLSKYSVPGFGNIEKRGVATLIR